MRCGASHLSTQESTVNAYYKAPAEFLKFRPPTREMREEEKEREKREQKEKERQQRVEKARQNLVNLYQRREELLDYEDDLY